jgi:transcription initiation factor TFIIF subunit beta
MAESFIKQEPFIKPDPEAPGSPAQVDEEDLYEDAGDLEFYEKNAGAFEQLYRARVPRYMWEAWSKLTERLGDDDEIQIGTLRTWNEQKPDGSLDVCIPDKTSWHHTDMHRPNFACFSPPTAQSIRCCLANMT